METSTETVEPTEATTEAETAEPTAISTDTEAVTPEDESYSMSIAPVGTVGFDEPPEEVYTAMPHHADMALALGRGGDIKAIVRPELFDGIYNKLFAQFDNLSVDWAELFNAYPTDKETLYEFDSDIHLEDPAYIASQDSMDPADIEEIGENVSPWFGNTYSNEQSEVSEPYAADYQYYTLWEIFGKVSQVFQEQERYEALTEIRDGLLSTIESNLPPEEERPRVARVLISFDGIDEGIWAYSTNGPGFVRAHTRPLGAKEAFPDLQLGSKVDLEALLEAEPDVLLRTASFSPGARWTDIKEELRNDSVAQEIPAVANDRVYPLAYRGAGPILLLDEPTTFLDVHHQLEVMEIVEALRDYSEVTIVLVIHDIEQAARYADYLLALNDGSIYARGPPEEVITEELLADVFEIEATVEYGGETGPDITPVGPLHDESTNEARREILRHRLLEPIWDRRPTLPIL